MLSEHKDLILEMNKFLFQMNLNYKKLNWLKSVIKLIGGNNG